MSSDNKDPGIIAIIIGIIAFIFLGTVVIGFIVAFVNEAAKAVDPIQALLGALVGGIMGGFAAAVVGVCFGKPTEKAARFGPLPWHEYPSSIEDLRQKYM